MSESEDEGEIAHRLPPHYLVVDDQKPTRAYILSGSVQLSVSNKLVLLARGRSISKAVDVALEISSKLGGRASVREIKLGSDQLSSGRYISTIEISMEAEDG